MSCILQVVWSEKYRMGVDWGWLVASSWKALWMVIMHLRENVWVSSTNREIIRLKLKKKSVVLIQIFVLSGQIHHCSNNWWIPGRRSQELKPLLGRSICIKPLHTTHCAASSPLWIKTLPFQFQLVTIYLNTHKKRVESDQTNIKHLFSFQYPKVFFEYRKKN